MFNVSIRPWVILALALVAAISCGRPTNAQAPSGQVEFKVFKVGFIVGAEGGSGTLTYKGKKYPLSVGGVSLGATLGMSEADLVGDVYNLNDPADIEGIYTAASAGVAIAGGGATARLKNSRGVELRVRGKQIGLELSIDLSGLSVKLK